LYFEFSGTRSTSNCFVFDCGIWTLQARLVMNVVFPVEVVCDSVGFFHIWQKLGYYPSDVCV
jgi:hypothetical protein